MTRSPTPAALRHAVFRLTQGLRRLRWWSSLGVRVIVPGPAGTVLLVRHSYVGGLHLPGGAVDRFERLTDAAVREVREETALALTGPLRLLGVYANFAKGFSDHVAVLVADSPPGEPRPDGREIVAAAFLDPDDPAADLTPATRRRIADWRAAAAGSPDW